MTASDLCFKKEDKPTIGAVERENERKKTVLTGLEQDSEIQV